MSKKKKKQPEYHEYIYCGKCGKAFCRCTDLPHLDYNYCPNCGHNLVEDKKKCMQEMNIHRIF